MVRSAPMTAFTGKDSAMRWRLGHRDHLGENRVEMKPGDICQPLCGGLQRMTGNGATAEAFPPSLFADNPLSAPDLGAFDGFAATRLPRPNTYRQAATDSCEWRDRTR